MKDSTEQEEIKNVYFERPHVVLLGAGASRACLPNGDKHGRKLPIMDDLVSVVGLQKIFDNASIEWREKNFEVLYSNLCKSSEYKKIREQIEYEVYEYFDALELPDTPTIYDYLVLSLRKKDLIASFNWDPLLFKCLERNHTYAEMPQVVFLHGNTYVGVCMEHKKMGFKNQKCNVCGKRFIKSKILYPIKTKKYTNDLLIESAWNCLGRYLKNAYIFTIFGYSAPTSDIEAIKIMQKAWGSNEKRELEEIEIIDIKNEDELTSSWDSFIHSHHYRSTTDYFNSFIANHPRRTCEAMWECLMNCRPYPDRVVPKNCTLRELQSWYSPLVEREKGGKKII